MIDSSSLKYIKQKYAVTHDTTKIYGIDTKSPVNRNLKLPGYPNKKRSP